MTVSKWKMFIRDVKSIPIPTNTNLFAKFY